MPFHRSHFRREALATAMRNPRVSDLLAFLALWLLVLADGLLRPLLPIDETRYVSVAWEMWQSQHWWVMHMNGAAYSDKPPLLFWLIGVGWEVFGVNAWWPKLISPLASLAACVHLYRIARRLGYTCQTARRTPIALMAMLLWALYSGAVMFDVLLTACLLGAIVPLIRGDVTPRRTLTSGLWLGFALLAKGPVALLTFLPIVLSAPLWRNQPFGGAGRRQIVIILGLGISLLLVWALPAAMLGGPDYARMLLWGQSFDRLNHSIAHARPVWWYLPWLPVLLFPWSLWPTAWPRRLPRCRHQRLAWIWGLSLLVIFSLISGKQLHYLMPALPAVALLVMDALSVRHEPTSESARTVALCFALLAAAGILTPLVMSATLAGQAVAPVGAGVVLGAALVLFRRRWQRSASAFVSLAIMSTLGFLLVMRLMLAPLWARYDVTAAAQLIAHIEQRGYPLAYLGKSYPATFQFAGRLRVPLEKIRAETPAVARWSKHHPDGWIVGRARDLPHGVALQPQIHRFAYRGGSLFIMPADAWQVSGAAHDRRALSYEEQE